MPRGRPNNQTTIVSNSDRIPKSINFNYSENFNRIIELTIDNYIEWKTNVLYLLCINNLDPYITSERIKKLRKRNVKENINDYIQDKFDDSLVYDKQTSEDDIKNDITVKWIIMNSLGDNTRKIIKSHNKTSFQIWKMLEKAFTKSPEQRRLDLRDKINNLKYDINEDIHIFIFTLQNYIDDLENIEGDLPDNTKVGILNRSLPENLRWINLFQFKDNWLKCTEYAKTVIPEIIFSNTKEIQKQRNIQLLNVVSTKGTHQNYHTNNKSISINSNSNRNNSRKNGRCRLCKKFGHYIAECWYNNKNRSNTKHNQHKSKNHPKHKNKPNKSVQNYRKINNSIYAINKTQEKDETIFPDSFISDYANNDTNKDLQINSIENQPEEKNFISKSSKKLSCWILDSGASIHTTNDKNLLINIRKCSEQISLPNGKIIKSTLIGNFIGSINGYKISLLDVHYTPDIKRNLISISSLIKNRYKVVFSYFNNQPYSIIYNEI
eukprot:jgi/Orpsp1_1/1184663/evm.model.c7180000090451.1